MTSRHVSFHGVVSDEFQPERCVGKGLCLVADVRRARFEQRNQTTYHSYNLSSQVPSDVDVAVLHSDNNEQRAAREIVEKRHAAKLAAAKEEAVKNRQKVVKLKGQVITVNDGKGASLVKACLQHFTTSLTSPPSWLMSSASISPLYIYVLRGNTF